MDHLETASGGPWVAGELAASDSRDVSPIQASPGRGWARGTGVRSYLLLGLAFGVAVLLVPQPLPAQAGETVEGRVHEADTDLGIQNAVVELEGYGSTLSDADGEFRFEGVLAGGYTLRVLAFGYAPDSRFIVVTGPTVLEIPLEVSPLPLDSVVVDMRRIDFEGRVRDPGEDYYLVGANVLTNQGTQTESDTHGRFRVDAYEEAPLQVSVRAFGYLPLDTVVTPDEDGRYVFDLREDSLVEKMVAVQVERLERRAAPRFAAGFR
ncbi:MAG: hypothetical protein GEU90_17850, partial [Gemmatimonas sp.]|nr:hypothetical protein [Gemmatimonas sp.]